VGANSWGIVRVRKALAFALQQLNAPTATGAAQTTSLLSGSVATGGWPRFPTLLSRLLALEPELMLMRGFDPHTADFEPAAFIVEGASNKRSTSLTFTPGRTSGGEKAVEALLARIGNKTKIDPSSVSEEEGDQAVSKYIPRYLLCLSSNCFFVTVGIV
jgi:hypothetical protein